MLVACRSAVLYSTYISNTQMQAEQLFLSAFAGKTIFLKEGFTMKKDGYYSSGEFARMAHVTLRTIRYYDKQNILKPSYVTESGARFYTDEDFARLSQILLLKYLGFSLDDIREMTIDDSDYHFMENSLNIQLKLVRDRIEQQLANLLEAAGIGIVLGTVGRAIKSEKLSLTKAAHGVILLPAADSHPAKDKMAIGIGTERRTIKLEFLIGDSYI